MGLSFYLRGSDNVVAPMAHASAGPKKYWQVKQPAQLQMIGNGGYPKEFNAAVKSSRADLIVLAGNRDEKAAKDAAIPSRSV